MYNAIGVSKRHGIHVTFQEVGASGQEGTTGDAIRAPGA